MNFTAKQANEFINAPIVTAPAKTAHPRPFSTYYYNNPKDGAGDWARIGRACTRETALRAGIFKLLKHEYMHIDVYNEDGVRCAFATRRGNRYAIVCV